MSEEEEKPKRKAQRKSVSMREDTYDKLRARCDADGVSASSVIEILAARYLASSEVIGAPTTQDGRMIAWKRDRAAAAVANGAAKTTRATIQTQPRAAKTPAQQLRDARPSEMLADTVGRATAIDVPTSSVRLPALIGPQVVTGHRVVGPVPVVTRVDPTGVRLVELRDRDTGEIRGGGVEVPRPARTLPEVLAERDRRLFADKTVDKSNCAWCDNIVRTKYVEDEKTGERYHENCAREMQVLTKKTGSAGTRA